MGQTEIYFNTLPLSGEKLQTAKNKAQGQNELILEFFVNNAYIDFTPTQIFLLFGSKWPLTSVRRAITTLTESGFLEKTSNMRKGMYGEMNHTWRLKPIGIYEQLNTSTALQRINSND